MRTPFIVAFNKVDERYTPSNRPTLREPGFFEKRRAEAAGAFGCQEADIFFLALVPDFAPQSESQAIAAELYSLGVLDFHTFYAAVSSQLSGLWEG